MVEDGTGSLKLVVNVIKLWSDAIYIVNLGGALSYNAGLFGQVCCHKCG